MSESRPDPFVGKSFDGYRIDEIIGRGGMGTVYKATQLSLGRPVALKVLTPDLAQDPQFLERFHREADVLSRLQHPNVVTVFDRGEVEGRPYLAMEFVQGTSLRDILRKGPCKPDEALRIVSSVLSALAHAHEKGIVHRDIKPENILLARGDIVKVADFGLSRLLGPEERTRLTRTQLVLGTYEYMAPEQREHSREADVRSDLYATGVVLYEMLTGELPIGRFGLPSRQRPQECDSRIDRLIERSLDKDPDSRYQSANEMANAVSNILDRPHPPEPELRLPPAPPRATAGPAPRDAYSPVRLEYHCDNVATADHVLGTICYAIGFASLFGLGFRRSFILVGIPFFAFFVAGWYLRETADGLRKFKRGARTAQAVIAILCGFTGVLLPFTAYSLWVLFGHRGRTYYEARARGLEAREAARYTYRLIEEPFGIAPSPRPIPPPPPPLPPTPSQIPVQSMVTSKVLEPSRPQRKRSLSGLVKAGFVIVALAFAAGGVMAVADWSPNDLAKVGVVLGLGVALLVIGGLGALFRLRGKGVIAALLGLLLAGGAAVAFDRYKHDYRVKHASLPERIQRVGSYKRLPEESFERDFFRNTARTAWLQEATDYPGEIAREVRLVRMGVTLSVQVPPNVAADWFLFNRIVNAVQEVVRASLGDTFEPANYRQVSNQLRDFIRQNPPPQ